MQIVFNLKSCEEPRQNKIQNHHRIFFLFCFVIIFFFFILFFHFIYTVFGVLNTTKTLRKRETTTKLKYSFPLKIVECYLQEMFIFISIIEDLYKNDSRSVGSKTRLLSRQQGL